MEFNMPHSREIYKMVTCEDENIRYLAGLPEQPNYKIEAKILLQKVLSREEMAELNKNLRQNNMKMVRDQRDNLIISGIPPDYQYNAQSILEEVKRFDKGARILP